MKLSCTKENLHQGLSITSHVGTKNVNLPILSNVLLKADAGGLKLISTNLEIAITCSIRAKVDQEGEYTVPSKLFYDFVNLLPNEPVNLDLHDEGLAVACAGAKTRIKGIEASEFPLIPPVSSSATFEIPATLLAQALSKTLFATATNESRPELTGALLSFNNQNKGVGTLTIAATDSYRLAEAVLKLPQVQGTQKDVIIPQRTLLELSRVFGAFKDDVDVTDTVKIGLSDNQVVFEYGPVEIISRVIEGNYPDYHQIIPKNTNTQIVVDRSKTVQGIKAASLFSKTGLYDVIAGLDAEKNALVLQASDATRGKSVMTVDGELTGGANEITINYRYLLDGLNAIGSDKVQLEVIDAANPCVLVPHEEDGYTYIVMPIRN